LANAVRGGCKSVLGCGFLGFRHRAAVARTACRRECASDAPLIAEVSSSYWGMNGLESVYARPSCKKGQIIRRVNLARLASDRQHEFG
jgi:hypothetical protein